ncbi:hypothetical protein MHBO_001751 [Bonamia ostreae]|uniref:Uncharacterized protein n=1 Tax=Bonamia ostreae TaxID=126728 RepID=A0ABV2AK15_9EUKA
MDKEDLILAEIKDIVINQKSKIDPKTIALKFSVDLNFSNRIFSKFIQNYGNKTKTKYLIIGQKKGIETIKISFSPQQTDFDDIRKVQIFSVENPDFSDISNNIWDYENTTDYYNVLLLNLEICQSNFRKNKNWRNFDILRTKVLF